jgi:hypothetical protein
LRCSRNEERVSGGVGGFGGEGASGWWALRVVALAATASRRKRWIFMARV